MLSDSTALLLFVGILKYFCLREKAIFLFFVGISQQGMLMGDLARIPNCGMKRSQSKLTKMIFI